MLNLTLVKYLCGTFEEFTSTQQPDIFTNCKQSSKETVVKSWNGMSNLLDPLGDAAVFLYSWKSTFFPDQGL